jgi:hypothetical protein
MRFMRAALATVAALTLCVAIGAPAAGAATRDVDERDRPVARAACPICVVGAVAIGRAALAVRAASTAPTIVSAGLAARAVTGRLLDRVTRATVRRVQGQARRISRRGPKWIRARWPAFKLATKACLATIAFMEAKGYLQDRIITRREWRDYVIFGPGLLQVTDFHIFPMRFDLSEAAQKVTDEALSCAIGLGAEEYFENR